MVALAGVGAARRNVALLAAGDVDDYIERSFDRPDASTPPDWVSPPLIALDPHVDDGLAFDADTRVSVAAAFEHTSTAPS